ncbi:MAG: DUF3015 family protein [Halobacteriovoraceae bacterium]|nr:DUF3015 family protein [Halobacteriovoraceae bacterium]MCB9093561.1 DUF3015 family protein [Halobacteriovoraceae bacterium]
MKNLIALVFILSIPKLFSADGSSGCGPGWYLLKENSLVSSSLRATTNGVLAPVTTIGMTVGTSNCTQHKIVKTEKEAQYYATMNYFELKNETALGEGAFLSAFGQTIGCGQAELSYLNSKLQENYQNLFPASESNPDEMLKEVYKIILKDQKLLQSCSLS